MDGTKEILAYTLETNTQYINHKTRQKQECHEQQKKMQV